MSSHSKLQPLTAAQQTLAATEYQRAREIALGIAMKRGYDKDELISESHYLLLLAASKFKPEQGKFRHFVTSLLSLNLNNYVTRKRGRKCILPTVNTSSLDAEDNEFITCVKSREPDPGEGTKEEASLVRKALRRLPDDERHVLTTVYLHGRTLKEAAKEVGWKGGGASYKCNKALNRLKDALRVERELTKRRAKKHAAS